MTMSLAAQILMEDMDTTLRFTGVDAAWRRETKFGLGEINKNITKAVRDFNKARTAYDTFIEPSRTKCLTDKKTGKFNVLDNDDNMRDANEMLRLLLLYYDKCFQDFDNVNAVFKYLRSLKGQGAFTDADVERFRI